jgi:hypothetical protein
MNLSSTTGLNAVLCTRSNTSKELGTTMPPSISLLETNTIPPVAWIPSGLVSKILSRAAKPQSGVREWPYLTRTIYARMGISQNDEEPEEDPIDEEEKVVIEESIISANLDILADVGFKDKEKNRDLLKKYGNVLDRCLNHLLDNPPSAADLDPKEQAVFEESIISVQLHTLANYGFKAKDKNRDLLKRYGNDVDLCLNHLLEELLSSQLLNPGQPVIDLSNDDSFSSTAESSSFMTKDVSPTTTKMPTTPSTPAPPKLEDCPICYNAFDPKILTFWQALTCSHKLCCACCACYAQIEDIEVIEESIISEKLDTLANFGFKDEDKNRNLLKKYGNDVHRCLNHLLEEPPTSPPLNPGEPKNPIVINLSSDDSNSSSSSATGSSSSIMMMDVDPSPSTTTPTPPAPPPKVEDCPICYNAFDPNIPTFWKTLTCSHKVCRNCYTQIETTRITMSGKTHTSIRCPFCQGISGM